MKGPAKGGQQSKAKGARRVPPSPCIDPDAFRLARGRATLTREAAAGFPGVSERTIRDWEAGRAKIPYAAFKLLRCYSGFELPHPAWEGFTFHKDTLWSPDRRAYRADDLGHLDVILAMARNWLADYKRRPPSLTSLPSSNVVQFPARGRAASAGELDQSTEEKETQPGWLPRVVKR